MRNTCDSNNINSSSKNNNNDVIECTGDDCRQRTFSGVAGAISLIVIFVLKSLF